MNKTNSINVGCYIRVSTENQIENYSIDEQIERLSSYCKAKDWNIQKFYTDAGYSGGNINRPALNQMLDDINNQKINMVVVYKLDRLSRSQKDTLMLIEDKFLSNNVEFVSMSENFDTSTPFGRAMIGILSIFAQLEKDQITERFTMGRIGRCKSGFFHGGSNPPTGYRYVNGRLIIDEYKAIQVNEVFSLFLLGKSINSIQKFMHNKYGNWSSHSLVLNVLKNSTYIGKVKFKGIEYNGMHKPIIDEAKFKQVQLLLSSKSNKNSSFKTPFRAGYLLSSIIFCNHCGAKYSANHGFYKCYSRSKSHKNFIIDPNCKNKNYKIEFLDNIILDQVEKFIQHNFKTYINKKIFNNSNNTIHVENRIKEIDIQISRITDLYQNSLLSIDELNSRIIELKKEKNFLLIEYEQQTIKEKKLNKKLLHKINNFKTLINYGTLEEKRLLISNIISSIKIDDNKIIITWFV